ncbi:MAG: hypothetical protein LBS57_10115 [Treponema sp.]|jgi:tetratricopeptide (TPR) repeat protein|nr:hypothetical protein [Treponema sp.]
MPLPKLSALPGKLRGVFGFPRGPGTGFLRITFFSGLILFFILGAILAVFSILRGGEAGGNVFHRSLREYDRIQKQIGAGRGDFKSLESLLDKMEKKAEGVESLLSVLKRRRRLSQLNPLYISAYQDAARRAIEAYPYSEVLAAAAAGALVRRGAINRETETKLRELMPLLASARFSPLLVNLHVLLGDLKNPEKAAGEFNTAGLRNALAGSLPSPGASPPERESIDVDLALLKLLNRESPVPEIQNLIANSPSPESIRFAAEYFYDFGDPLRSAELFSLLPDDAGLSRQADALWLGGYIESARNIWKILASPSGTASASALYNLALSAADKDEEAELLGRIAAMPESSDPGRKFGLIRYSRLFNAPRGIAVLEAAAPVQAPAGGKDLPRSALRDPLIELELLRRGAETWEQGRTVGEIWLLLGRHGEDENLYQWAAWYFGLQRNYSESAALLKIAGRRGFSGEWLSFHEALRRIREGGFDEAEETLRRLAGGAADWQNAAAWAGANLGLLLEARHSPAGALEFYEKAAAALEGLPEQDQYRRETCSRIRLYIARCLLSLGRPGESRRALEYALDLNPDNLKARLELERIGRR